MKRIFGLASTLSALALPAMAAAQSPTLAFGPALSDGAVLQRGQPIEISGTAPAAARISVTLGTELRAVKADKSGRWRAVFPALPATDSVALTVVSGMERLELGNIAIGDVFLCSGQSNMQFSMAEAALNPNDRRLAIDRSISLLSVPIAPARVEQAEFARPAKWANAFAESADFSAVCLIAGRTIAQTQKVRVGLIDASMGGTPIQAWLPYEGLKQAGVSEGVTILDTFKSDPAAAEARLGAELDGMWKMPPPPGQDPDRPRMGYANLFNGMIAPLTGTRFAGAIWYQGENNTRRADPRAAYKTQLKALLASWRGRFGAQLPFAIVQLAPFGPLSDVAEGNSWAEVREAQRQVAVEDPLAELVTTVDVGERLDIHPPLKKPVGQRAAAALSHLIYGAPVEALGPQPLKAVREGSLVRIGIASAGLMAASWGRPGPFMLCGAAPGAECRFADARFVADGIVVEIPEGLTPDLVRYCWGAAPICNVFDRAQRPLPAFELPVAP